MPAAELRGGFALHGGVGFTDGERPAVAWRDGDGVRVHLIRLLRAEDGLHRPVFHKPRGLMLRGMKEINLC